MLRKAAEDALAEAMDKLSIKKKELKIILDNVAALEAKLEGAKLAGLPGAGKRLHK